MIIGISGYKDSGKNAFANGIMAAVPSATAIAFADPLKEFAARVYDWPLASFESYVFKEAPDRRYVRLDKEACRDFNDLIDAWHSVERVAVADRPPHLRGDLHQALGLTYEEYVDWVETGLVHLTPRYALQHLGTEWGRACCRETWTNYGIRRARELERAGRLVLITDVRFVNEARIIASAGGYVVRVHRDGKSPGEHGSEREQSMIQADLVVDNDGTLEQLHHSAAQLALGLVARSR